MLDESGAILFLHGGVRQKAKHTDRRQACREKYTAEMKIKLNKPIASFGQIG